MAALFSTAPSKQACFGADPFRFLMMASAASISLLFYCYKSNIANINSQGQNNERLLILVGPWQALAEQAEGLIGNGAGMGSDFLGTDFLALFFADEGHWGANGIGLV